MPASMIIALAGFIVKVIGSSIAMVAGGPSPGMTPTAVPRSTPMKHQKRFAGSSATAKPCISPERISIFALKTEHAQRQGDAQRKREHEVRAGGARQRHQ